MDDGEELRDLASLLVPATGSVRATGSIASRPIRAVKAKIRALTHRTSQQDLAPLLTRFGQIMRGCASYFKHAVAKWTFSKLNIFTWWRIVRMLQARHGWNGGQLRRHLVTPAGRWLIAAGGIEYFRLQGVTVSRYAYRETRSHPHGPLRTPPDGSSRAEPVAGRPAGRVRRAFR